MSTKGMISDEVYYIVIGGTYAIVFFTTVVQGLTLKPVYNRIKRSMEKTA
jgi:CPA1 family monovalent cation:H+ antiporter